MSDVINIQNRLPLVGKTEMLKRLHELIEAVENGDVAAFALGYVTPVQGNKYEMHTISGHDNVSYSPEIFVSIGYHISRCWSD